MRTRTSKARFTAARKLDAWGWGIWDRRQRRWAETPRYEREPAERIAKAVMEAYAAGRADADAATESQNTGLPYRAAPNPKEPVAWGVCDVTPDGWVEPTVYGQRNAEQIADVLNEAFAAGLTDAIIDKVRIGARATLFPQRP